MYTNGVSNNYNSYNTAVPAKETKPAQETTDKKETVSEKTEQAVVYEPTPAKTVTETAKKNSKSQNAAIVNQMKADLAKRKQQLQDMVTKMLGQQGKAWQKSQIASNGTAGVDIYKLLQSGELQVDPETAAQAKADVAEDGYWGVNQTSDRFLSFAKALTGGDSNKADEMLAAFKKGFEQATAAWGSKLPELCQKTYDATIKKFEAWKNGTEE